MEYTTLSATIVAEAFSKGTPTQGQEAFAGRISELFAENRDLVGLDTYAAEVGYVLEDFVCEYDARGLFNTFRDLTGESTDDIDHAMALVYGAAESAFTLLADDYKTFLEEK